MKLSATSCAPVTARASFSALSVLVLAFAIASLGCAKNTGGSGDAGSTANRGAGAKVFPLHALDGGARSATDAATTAAPTGSAERGKVLYEKYCGFCHGAEGKGYAADEAPAIANEEFLALASDEYLTRAIVRGRPGTTMSAWSTQRGGPLNDGDVASLVAHVRSWQKKDASAGTPASTGGPDAGTIVGDVTNGKKVYAASCAACHGAEGHDGKYIALGNPELLATVSDEYLKTSIERGRPGTPMLPYASKLSAKNIGDVVALIRSWQKPVDELVVIPPKPGELTNVVINPKGPPAKLDEKADFIPVDTIKKAIDAGGSLVILDARAPSDYVRAHVAGAISVPFYQVEAYAKQIPKDRMVITYCACPHAVSVKARDALRHMGYKSAVLDEGVITWRDRGYPIRGGAKP